MFFILSKVLFFLIDPLFWVFALFIAGIFIKKAKLKKRFIIAAAIVLYVFSIPLVFDFVAKCWDIRKIPKPVAKPYSCAIVLGGFSSESADGKRGYFNEASDRFIQAVRLYDIGQVSHILVTSGNPSIHPDGFEEADWVKGQLEQFKVPDSCILIENRSRNTIENAQFSKKILDKTTLKPPYLLITSAFHMRRSMYIFQKTGYNVLPYPCHFSAGAPRINLDSFFPSPVVLAGWGIYVKEMIGLTVTRFKL